MSGRILQEDGDTRMVEVSANYDYNWSGALVEQKVVGFSRYSVDLFQVDFRNEPPTVSLSLTAEEAEILFQAFQAYRKALEALDAEREADRLARQRVWNEAFEDRVEVPLDELPF